MIMKINKNNKNIKIYFSLRQFMLNNEIIHFIISYKYHRDQIFMDTYNGKQNQYNLSTLGETRNMIQDYFIKKNIFKYI